jgi:hypothetical protein
MYAVGGNETLRFRGRPGKTFQPRKCRLGRSVGADIATTTVATTTVATTTVGIRVGVAAKAAAAAAVTDAATTAVSSFVSIASTVSATSTAAVADPDGQNRLTLTLLELSPSAFPSPRKRLL